MDFALQTPGLPHDAARARQLLAEAGYPNGIDAGDFVPIPPFFATAEAAVNYLNAVGIRVRIRTMERAAFYAAWREKKLRGLFMVAAGNSGNAASRVAEFVSSKGSYAYGGYPDIDDLVVQQARERDPRKREALLRRIQQLTIDRVMSRRSWTTARCAAWARARPSTCSTPSTWYRSPPDMRMK
jgi:peptide/nickel transport system substrate-binding protein